MHIFAYFAGMGTGTLKYQYDGKIVTAYVSNVASKDSVVTLANDLHDAGFSLAAIPYVTFCEGEYVNIPESSPDASTDVGLFANVLLRRDSDSKLYGLLIHAPNMNMFEKIDGQGYKVIYGDGVAVADMYSACAGETYSFYEGWLQGSSLRGFLAP